jgi:hypothetical protein
MYDKVFNDDSTMGISDAGGFFVGQFFDRRSSTKVNTAAK